MGLLVEFDVIEDFGYLEQTEQFGIIPSYDIGCQVFVETFLNTAKELVPVDTGYLRLSLEADCDDTSCRAETNCEYAQYPEFGTWCQAAQPYFTPALEEAIMAAEPYWNQAQLDAENEEAELVEQMSSQGSWGMGGFQMAPLTKEDLGYYTPESAGFAMGTASESNSHFAGYHTSSGVYDSFDSYMANHYMPAVNSIFSSIISTLVAVLSAIISSLFSSISKRTSAPMGQVFIPEVIIT